MTATNSRRISASLVVVEAPAGRARANMRAMKPLSFGLVRTAKRGTRNASEMLLEQTCENDQRDGEDGPSPAKRHQVLGESQDLPL